MSFASRFKSPNQNPTDVPPGVNIAHTSFGYNKNQTPYSIPPVSKPNTTNTQTIRPGGGWDESDEEEEQPQIRGGSGPYRGDSNAQPSQPITKTTVSNGSHDTGFAPSRKKVDPNVEFAFLECDSNFMQSHEHENNTINSLIQPGGARLKQPDNILNDFCRASENFQAPAIGSLLITKLTEDIPFVSKARTLFAIETLVKKVPKYFSYFKHNLPILQGFDFANEGSNASQLLKILEDISNHLLEITKPKPTAAPQFTQQIPVKTTRQSANLLEGDGDLLGMGTTTPTEQPKKQDPFAFVSNQPTSNVGPKKIDPFALSGPTSNPTPVTTTTKPSGGLPGNFKKFHANANANPTTNIAPIHVKTQPITQPSHSNDLLGQLNDLHFEASPSQSPTLAYNQQNLHQDTPHPIQNGQNKGGFSGQTQGFGNQPNPSGYNMPHQGNYGGNHQDTPHPVQNGQNKGGFSGQIQGFGSPSGYNMGSQWNYGNNQHMNMNMNVNMNFGTYGNQNNQFYGGQQQQQQQRGYPNQNYQPQGNFGYGYAGNYQGNNMNMVDPSKKFDDMDNLLTQSWTFASDDDKKKKQKSENEKAFDSLRF